MQSPLKDATRQEEVMEHGEAAKQGAATKQGPATKHGLAAGIQQPLRPDWTIDQGWSAYTAEEHAVWRTLFERQRRLLPGRACDAFIEGCPP